MFNHSGEILWLAGVQCAQIGVLFVGVWCCARWLLANRPYLSHGLWVLLLIKCVTPPVWSSEVGVFSWVLYRPMEHTSVMGEAADPMGMVVNDPRLIREMKELASALPEAAPITMTTSDGIANSRLDGGFRDVHEPRVRWTLIVLLIWGAGAVILFTATLGRFLIYRRKIWKSAIAHNEMWDEHLDVLRKRLGVWRRVRLVVTREPMGPAVFGLLRPTIVLPEGMIGSRSPSELEPILAHELIHVRRGDLWIGLLQLSAGAVWWFYPPVWIAIRRVRRTSEACCDLAVVDALPHARRAYADLLLDVLARKQSLRAIPLVPGMKAGDVTSRRMERIMTFQSKPRRWTTCLRWAVLMGVAVVTLPGAGWEEDRESQKKSIMPVEAAKSAGAETAKKHQEEDLVVVAYRVPHVYESLMKAGVDRHGAEKLLTNVILHEQRRQCLTMSQWMPPPQFDDVKRLNETPTITIKTVDDDDILVRAEHATHERIQHLLRGLYETGVNRFAMMIEHRVVKKNDVDALNVDWRTAGMLHTEFIPEDPTIEVPAVPDPRVIQFASIPRDSKDIEKLFDQSRWIEPFYGAAGEDEPMIHAMFNGQSQWCLGALESEAVIDPTAKDRDRRIIPMQKGIGLVARLDAETSDTGTNETTFEAINCHLEYYGASPSYNSNDEDPSTRSRPRCYVRQETARLQFPIALSQPILIRGLPAVPPHTTKIEEDQEWIIGLWIEQIPTEIWRRAGSDEFRIEPVE